MYFHHFETRIVENIFAKYAIKPNAPKILIHFTKNTPIVLDSQIFEKNGEIIGQLFQRCSSEDYLMSLQLLTKSDFIYFAFFSMHLLFNHYKLK